MEKRIHLRYIDTFEREEYLNRQSFGHDISEKIEIEPFSYPSIALQNTRILELIKKKF